MAGHVHTATYTPAHDHTHISMHARIHIFHICRTEIASNSRVQAAVGGFSATSPPTVATPTAAAGSVTHKFRWEEQVGDPHHTGEASAMGKKRGKKRKLTALSVPQKTYLKEALDTGDLDTCEKRKKVARKFTSESGNPCQAVAIHHWYHQYHANNPKKSKGGK